MPYLTNNTPPNRLRITTALDQSMRSLRPCPHLQRRFPMCSSRSFRKYLILYSLLARNCCLLQDLDRKKEYMEVKDQCVATVRHVNQLQQHMNEESKKVTKFVSSRPHSLILSVQGENVESIEKLHMALSEDLTKFKIAITDAVKECRQLVIDESKLLSSDISKVQQVY